MALAAEHYVADTEALYANLFSFNRWYDETWGFNHDDRLFATALLSLRDLDKAVELRTSCSSEALESCCSRPALRTAARPAIRTSIRCGRA